MPGYMDVDAAIKVAKKILGEKRVIIVQLDTVRTDLRNAVSRKETTPEQTRWIGEQFPLRERKSKNKAAEPVKAAV